VRLTTTTYSRGVWSVFAIRAIETLGWSATIPFFAIYLLNERTVSLPIIGTIYLISGASSFATQILGGRLSDQYGPRLITILALGGGAGLAGLLAEMITLSSSVFMLASLFTMYSVVRGLYIPSTSAVVATEPRTAISSSFSIVYIGGNLGYMVGPAIGGLLIQSDSYSAIFALCAVTTIVAALVTAIWMSLTKSDCISEPVKLERRQSYWLKWKTDKIIIMFLVLVFFLSYSNGYQNTPLSLFAANFVHLDTASIGYIYATNGLTVVLLQFPLIRLINRITDNLTLSLAISCISTCVSCLLAGISSNFLQLEFVMFCLTIGEIFLSVPAQSMLALFSTSWNRGTYQGYYFAFSESGKNLCLFLGPLSFALLAKQVYLAWDIVAVFSLLIFAGFIILSPRVRSKYIQDARTTDIK